jgi:hypothetical protein
MNSPPHPAALRQLGVQNTTHGTYHKSCTPRGITLGEAITDLIRKSSQAASSASETPKFGRSASGFPTFPPKNRILTTEMVLKAQEEEFV